MEFVAACALVALLINQWDERRHLRGIANVHRESAQRWEQRYYEVSRDFRALAEIKRGE